MQNLFELANLDLKNEFTESLVTTSAVRIERIISLGHANPAEGWFDQSENEWFVLLSGEAALEYQSGKTVRLLPGDHCLIPSNQRHRVKWTKPDEPTVWLAVFFKSEE
ncbi:cupin domain-containing protein [bacterium]|nr:cupin domain-containing protein [bacterium]MDC0278578.1 cupin domain-containing protein [bacterium]